MPCIPRSRRLWRNFSQWCSAALNSKLQPCAVAPTAPPQPHRAGLLISKTLTWDGRHSEGQVNGSFDVASGSTGPVSPPKGRGRVNGKDFGLPGRDSLTDLAATTLDL